MINNNYLINNVKCRLIYSFFISDNITSLYDNISYKIHFLCLDEILKYVELFNEVIIVITANDLNNKLITELKITLSNIFISTPKITFIVEQNDSNFREGKVFKKYVINKLGEYDGLTLFFHNKGINSKYDNNFPYYWIISQYYFNFLYFYYYNHDSFITNNEKLLYGFPYICDYNQYRQWFYAGSCYWMKCQQLNEYFDNNKDKTYNLIPLKTIAEYFFLEKIDKKHVDYPFSNILKDKLFLFFEYDFYDNKFNKYLQSVIPYKDYLEFKEFYDIIMNRLKQ